MFRHAENQALSAAGSAGAGNMFLSCKGQCLKGSPLMVSHPSLTPGMLTVPLVPTRSPQSDTFKSGKCRDCLEREGQHRGQGWDAAEL